MPGEECPNTIQVRSLVKLLKDKSEDLVGNILTQLDSSMTTGKQCNAMKLIVKRQIYAAFNDIIGEISHVGGTING